MVPTTENAGWLAQLSRSASTFVRRVRRSDRRRSGLVPSDDAAGRSLAAVVAILTFLASLAVGAAETVARSSSQWASSVSREATIQVRPRANRDLEADLARASAIAREVPGIADARAIPKAEAEALLAPWLGHGLDLAALPVPGLVVLRLAPGPKPDFAALGARLAADVPTASVDDHAQWLSRLSVLSGSIVGGAAAIVLIVLAASGLAVAFATRGAMAGARDTVEVLHLVGAGERFITRQFAAGFLRIGLGGAAVGGAAAVGTVALAGYGLAHRGAEPGGAELEAFIGAFEPGLTGYGLILVVALAVALIAGLMSALTARRLLRADRTR